MVYLRGAAALTDAGDKVTFRLAAIARQEVIGVPFHKQGKGAQVAELGVACSEAEGAAFDADCAAVAIHAASDRLQHRPFGERWGRDCLRRVEA